MELIDTPNPNAKKIIVDHNFDISEYLNSENINKDDRFAYLIKIDNIESVFTGPGFLTIIRKSESHWDVIKEDIKNNFDKL